MRARFQAVARRLLACVCLLAAVVTASAAAEPEILELGEGAERFWVVDHGDRISIYAKAVSASTILDALKPLGGPTYTSFEPLTRPVTLTLHRARMEDVLRKMLDGYSYAYRYRGGRIVHVRVLPLIAGRHYKTAPAVETREQWEAVERELANDTTHAGS